MELGVYPRAYSLNHHARLGLEDSVFLGNKRDMTVRQWICCGEPGMLFHHDSDVPPFGSLAQRNQPSLCSGSARVLVIQSCPTLCDPMDCSPPGSSVCGILQARILEWVAMPSSRGSSRPRYWTCISWVSRIAGRFFTVWATSGRRNECKRNKIQCVLPLPSCSGHSQINL